MTLTHTVIPWRRMWRHPKTWRPAARFLVWRFVVRPVRRRFGVSVDRTSDWTYPTKTWRQP